MGKRIGSGGALCACLLLFGSVACGKAGTAQQPPPATPAVAAATAVAGADAPATAAVRTTTSTATRNYLITNPQFEALPGARALYGELNGAAYEIEVPERWNGDLVLYAHGFTGNDPLLFVQAPPLRRYFIARGFAWAASSYATSGYNPDQGLRDTLALRDQFSAAVGAPRRTYIDGTSMGGHIVVSALEQRPELFAGGLSECGVVAGVEDLDYLVSYAALAGYVTSVQLPLTDPIAYLDTVRTRLLPALGPANAPSAAGTQFEALIASLTGGARPWRHRGFVDRRAANLEALGSEDPAHPSLGARAASNADTRYTADPAAGVDIDRLNATIVRLPGDPTARNADQHPDFAPRTGRLKAPLLTLHTTGDHFVPFSLEQSYRRTVDAAGAGDLLVQRAVRRPDHCQFTPAELERGFADLVAWVDQGVKPAGDDLRTPDLRDVGRQFTDPLLPGDPGDE